ncbi:MAG: adenylyl-sulfate kinase [Chitinophagales bacterium]|nr:adenylyl-sulfate kinase [Chitinophagales bacterium]
MQNKPENIHPIFNTLLNRESKEKLLNQRAKVIWFTGLSGSGKSTIAKGLENELHLLGYLTMVLDGDNVRTGINNNLGFSEEDRKENIRRIAEVAKILLNSGVIAICCFVSPTEELRTIARNIIGKDDFVEVFVNTSIEECERRDVKGLYAKARKGEIKDFTGISAPFEAPANPDVDVKTNGRTVYETVREVVAHILPLIKCTNKNTEDQIVF